MPGLQEESEVKDDDRAQAEQEFLRTLYNVLLMTSDFSMGGSWDVYTGVRLGGGIQEAAFAMCGHLAWYRMKKDKETRQAELAAYLAARQMPSVFAQFCGNRWVREYIYAVDLANLPAYEKEQQYDWRFAELNELPGLSRSTIVGDNFIFSLILVGMPEIMRFYNRYAKDDALYFLTHQLNPGREMIWWDTRVYPNHMMSFADYWLYIIGADRSKIYDVFLTEPKYRTRGYGQIGNARAVLESAGTIEYREE